VGVAANELADPQLALLLCRLLAGGPGSPAEQRLLRTLCQQAEASGSSDAAAAIAACRWLEGDAAKALSSLLTAPLPQAAAANSSPGPQAAQLLPLLRLLLLAARPNDAAERVNWQRQLGSCLASLATALAGCGLHSWAVEAAAIAALMLPGDQPRHQQQQQPEGCSQHVEQLAAVALLPGLLEQRAGQQGQRQYDVEASRQVKLLQQQGLPLNTQTMLALLQSLRGSCEPSGGFQSAAGWTAHPAGSSGGQQPLLERHSSGGSSHRSRDSEQHRWQAAARPSAGNAVLGEG
jgi:hypothetical protein